MIKEKLLNNQKSLIIILFFIFIADIVIFLNIPFLSQFLGFLFLTILPGFLIMQILRMNKIGYTEKFVLTVGLSISFLMFYGLLLNEFSLWMGYKAPLSTNSILTSFSVSFIILAIVGFKLNKNTSIALPHFNLTTTEKKFLIIPIFFPTLGILGMYFMNTWNNNILLMLLLFLIPIYVIIISFLNEKFPKRLYPVLICLISISLVLLLALRSDHIIGRDTHKEYYFFLNTLNNLHWQISESSTLGAVLSISLLTTIYQSILNINPEFLFKILFSLLFSISPLIVFILSKKYIGDFYGFLSSFFFMAQQNFLFTELQARTNISILFVAIAMMILFNNKINILIKKILFLIFISSIIISHYSTTYMFFFILLGSFLGLQILSYKYSFQKHISPSIVMLFFSMMFYWYSLITRTTFIEGIKFIEKTVKSFNELFIEESRSQGVSIMIGQNILEKSIIPKIGFVLTWFTFVFIGLGIIVLMIRYKAMSFPELNFQKADFLKEKFSVSYFMIVIVFAGLLIGTITVPFISKGYNMDRVYFVALPILSIFFVIGGIVLSKILRTKAYLVILSVLIPYFFFTTGFMHTISGASSPIILNSDGEQYDLYFVHDSDSYGARWLKDNFDGKSIIYSDFYGIDRIISQAGIQHNIDEDSFLKPKIKIYGYIYLRYTGVVKGKLLDRNYQWYNISEFQDKFTNKSMIYSNGGSQIYR